MENLTKEEYLAIIESYKKVLVDFDENMNKSCELLDKIKSKFMKKE